MSIRIVKRKLPLNLPSSDEYNAESGYCTIEYFIAAKDEYRVAAGDIFPVPWPFAEMVCSKEAAQVVDIPGGSYGTILKEMGIKYSSISLHSLQRNGYRGPDQFLIVATEDEDTSLWKAAANLLQESIDNLLGAEHGDLKIGVEIRNHKRMFRDVSTIMIPGSLEHQACLAVKDYVSEAAKTCLGGFTRTISYHMRGPVEDSKNRKPTILISVPIGIKSLWHAVEDRIQEASKFENSLDVEMHVEIVTGSPLP